MSLSEKNTLTLFLEQCHFKINLTARVTKLVGFLSMWWFFTLGIFYYYRSKPNISDPFCSVKAKYKFWRKMVLATFWNFFHKLIWSPCLQKMTCMIITNNDIIIRIYNIYYKSFATQRYRKYFENFWKLKDECDKTILSPTFGDFLIILCSHDTRCLSVIFWSGKKDDFRANQKIPRKLIFLIIYSIWHLPLVAILPESTQNRLFVLSFFDHAKMLHAFKIIQNGLSQQWDQAVFSRIYICTNGCIAELRKNSDREIPTYTESRSNTDFFSFFFWFRNWHPIRI
jgi:hypothetical protein